MSLINKEKRQAIIVGAGFGTRLEGEYTGPKGTIPLEDGEDILYRIISNFFRKYPHQILAMITNGRDLEAYQQWAKKHSFEDRIEIISNGAHSKSDTQSKGAIGDMLFGLDEYAKTHDIEDRDIVFLPTDTIVNFEMSELIDYADKYPDSVITVVRKYDESEKDKLKELGCAILNFENSPDDEGAIVQEFHEKNPIPPSLYAAIPIYIIPSQLMSLVREIYQESLESNSGFSLDSPGQLMTQFVERDKEIRAFITTQETHDVGTPEVFHQVSKKN